MLSYACSVFFEMITWFFFFVNFLSRVLLNKKLPYVPWNLPGIYPRKWWIFYWDFLKMIWSFYHLPHFSLSLSPFSRPFEFPFFFFFGENWLLLVHDEVLVIWALPNLSDDVLVMYSSWSSLLLLIYNTAVLALCSQPFGHWAFET